VTSQFCAPDGLGPIADAIVKLPQLGQGLDQALPEERPGERGPEVGPRWESSEGAERPSEQRHRCGICPQAIVGLTQVELGGQPQHYILVDQREGPLAEDHGLFRMAREP
jgi:hypothetical protein